MLYRAECLGSAHWTVGSDSAEFSEAKDSSSDQPISDSAYRAAREALNGSDPTGGAIYYFNPATATSKWIWSRPQMLTIGSHIFCA